MEALALYVVAFASFFLAAYALMGDQLDETMFGASDLKIATAAAIIGTCCIFVGLSKVVDASLILAASRMGADRARSLRRSEAGGWDVDPTQSFEYLTIMGEVESYSLDQDSQKMNFFDSAFCGCYTSTLEMIAGIPKRDNNPFFRDDDASDGGDRENLRRVVSNLP